ncbi:hypothetical protein OW763_04750 [Clostridium aestuarii]|uniref:Uncharacterized protein n=1 Tax=Clostridium aestuarii TaxID=338193 RepID=A0ABT4CXE7_9CLOT|nr:hypothetical protein [Clostridium aestuarii]MCY6483660.1 hypothetical protein [Clostridium aestuarii]
MEYKLNKIDIELRQRVHDATKKGKIHGNKDLNKIDKDKREHKKEEREGNFKEKLAKQKKKKKITVDAVKAENVNIEAFKEEVSAGKFLNIKK